MNLRLRPSNFVWALALACPVIFLVGVLLGQGTAPGFQAVYVLSLAASAALMLMAIRTRVPRAQRLGWTLLAAGTLSYLAAQVHYFLVLQHEAVPAYPSSSDGGWIAGYALALAGVVLLARQKQTGFARTMWIDVLVGVLALAAVASALVAPLIVTSTGGRPSAVATGLTYPFLDVMIVGVLLAVSASQRWRPSRSWWILVAAYPVQLVADVVYARQVATGGYVAGGAVDMVWILMPLAVAGAAWVSGGTPPRKAEHLQGANAAALPLGFTAASLALLVYDHFATVTDLAFLLAAACIVAGFARTIATVSHLRTAASSRELLARQATILDAAGDGIYGIDTDGRATFVNPAAAGMFGEPPEELVGRDLAQFVQGGDDTYRNTDGTSFPVEVTATPVREGGEVTGAVVVFRDISERKRVERLKDEFTATVSHELRTPLTAIRGALGLVSGGVAGPIPDKAQRMLEIAAANTDRLVRLINDILDMEKMESGQIVMERRICQVEDLVRAATDVMRPLAAQAGITLQSGSDEGVVWADADRVTQTLTNLISNAIKFSPEGTTITLSAARSEGETIRFDVRDQGRGIPEEKLESIFERFQQVDGSDSREKGGTGLGLAISRRIAEQHDGSLAVHSILGSGSTFTLVLPALHVEAEAPADDAPLVLICDDDPTVVDGVEEVLSLRGYRTLSALSGPEAIRLAANQRPDVILLDILMPGMSGWETAQELGRDEATRDIPIVILSALSPATRPQDAPPVADWLMKPLDVGGLFAALAEVSERAPRPHRVLVLEDDPGLAQVLTQTLEGHGIKASAASSASQAREICKVQAPDLLLLDLVMPDEDGFAMLDWLAGQQALRALPTIVYTAKDLDAAERARLNRGGAIVLAKSRAMPEELGQLVSRLLATAAEPDVAEHQEVLHVV